MAGEDSEVDGQSLRLHRCEILTHRMPVPRHGIERGQRDTLDSRQQALHVVTFAPEWSNGESTVSAKCRGHPVKGRGTEAGVPKYLRVVVGVDVDESGRHDLAVRVNA